MFAYIRGLVNGPGAADKLHEAYLAKKKLSNDAIQHEDTGCSTTSLLSSSSKSSMSDKQTTAPNSPMSSRNRQSTPPTQSNMTNRNTNRSRSTQKRSASLLSSSSKSPCRPILEESVHHQNVHLIQGDICFAPLAVSKRAKRWFTILAAAISLMTVIGLAFASMGNTFFEIDDTGSLVQIDSYHDK